MPRDKVANLEDKFDGLRGDMDRLVQVVAAQQEMVIECRREWGLTRDAITAALSTGTPPEAAQLLAGRFDSALSTGTPPEAAQLLAGRFDSVRIPDRVLTSDTTPDATGWSR